MPRPSPRPYQLPCRQTAPPAPQPPTESHQPCLFAFSFFVPLSFGHNRPSLYISNDPGEKSGSLPPYTADRCSRCCRSSSCRCSRTARHRKESTNERSQEYHVCVPLSLSEHLAQTLTISLCSQTFPVVPIISHIESNISFIRVLRGESSLRRAFEIPSQRPSGGFHQADRHCRGKNRTEERNNL